MERRHVNIKKEESTFMSRALTVYKVAVVDPLVAATSALTWHEWKETCIFTFL